MTSFVPLDEAIIRKRKQEPASVNHAYPTELEHSYSFGGMDPMVTSFEYYPPTATSMAMDNNQALMHQHPMTGFYNNSGPHSRRHSLAIGELDYHYPVAFNSTNSNVDSVVKQEPLDSVHWGNMDFNSMLLDGDPFASFSPSLSSYSSGNSMDQVTMLPHQRTVSLRLENTSPSSQDRRMSYSPTTPAFSSNFLDSLSISTEEDANSFANQSFVDSVATNGDGSGYNSHQHITATPVPDGASPDFMVHLEQLAMQPSVSPQQQLQQPSDVCMMESLPPTMVSAKRQSISKQRRSSTFKPNRTPPPSSPATTMSPSPPITPSQHINSFESFHHNHPSIPEEEDEIMKAVSTSRNWSSDKSDEAMMERRLSAERRAKNSLVSARIVQGANSAQQLKPLIQQYLLSNDPSALGEHSVTLLTGKVAQKSYGTEKRFLCPPPTTVLTGASWWTTTSADSQDNDEDDMSTAKFLKSSSSFITGETLCAPKLAIHISGESSSQKGALEWCNANGSVIDSTPSLSTAAHASILGQTTLSGKCVSKQLHINDADEKRRRVEVLAKIQLGNGLTLGTLASKGIKVISKPSKKRQSTKNTELCIHHGTAVSLFNRIRSQTVSTKYLGVSNGDSSSPGSGNAGTCFVARTTSWDPFVIWIVDTSRSPGSASSTPPQLPHHPLYPDYPPPPAVALQSGISRQSPTAIHYNQSVVLQCVTTGLVSPVMVIRKVDKGSAVFGGNGMEDLSGLTGGECGDEAIGDPVSQLHKIAFQIVQDASVAYNNKMNNHPRPPSSSSPSGWTLPQTSHPVTYLACLNDVVGMHKTTTPRSFVSTRPPPTAASISLPPWHPEFSPTQSSFYSTLSPDPLLSSVATSHIEPTGKMVRKRRVSCDVTKPSAAHPYGGNKSSSSSIINSQRRRVNSLNDVSIKSIDGSGRRGSLASDRRTSISSDNGNPVDGNCWTEDVSDAAVWTIMGTESVKYTFWTPPATMQQDTMTTTFNNPFTCPQQSHPITPFPVINHINSPSSTNNNMLISGESMARDLSVWFGDIKAPSTEYKSRELLSCEVPDKADLECSLVAKADDDRPDLMKIPILLVRGDGVVYRTGEFYTF